MLGLCWAYLDPFLAYIGWPRSKILTPFEKHAKTQDSRAKMPPPKLKLISYNAIANGSRRHTKNASAPSVRADFGEFLMILEGFWGRLLMIFDGALNERFGDF